MDKLRPKRFINCYVPTQACNFRCNYCYIGQKKVFNNEMFHCIYPMEIMKKQHLKNGLEECVFLICVQVEKLYWHRIYYR